VFDDGCAFAQRGLVAPAQDDMATFRAEVGGDLPADAFARAGYDRDPVAQAQVHRDQPSAAIRSA
jgi:hypothetical protein